MACCSTSGRASHKRLHASVAAAEADTLPTVACPVMPGTEPSRFVNNSTAFVEQLRIRGYEAGPDQRANIVTIANLLQVGAEVTVRALQAGSASPCIVRAAPPRIAMRPFNDMHQ